MSDWQAAVDGVRSNRAAADLPDWSVSAIICARAIDAVEQGTLEAGTSALTWHGQQADGWSDVVAALGVPGIRGMNPVVAGGGQSGVVPVGNGAFPDVLRSRFVARDIDGIVGTLFVQFISELDGLWKRIGDHSNLWSSNQISRIRSAVMVGVPILPSSSTSAGKPPGLTAETVESFQQIVGRFQTMAALYTRSKLAEAVADAQKTQADQSFWDTVAFWKSRTPPVPNSGSSGDLFTDWWNDVKSFWAAMFKNTLYTVLIIAAVVGVVYLIWINRARIGTWIGSTVGKAVKSKGNGA